jgi:hypothetical protein
MHHDLAWWGVFLAVVGLILMFPVAVLANILTPKLKNWWAERSEASTKKRIEKLEQQLADCEQHEELSFAEDYLLKGIEALGIVGTMCVEILSITLAIVAKGTTLLEDIPPDRRFASAGLLVMTALFSAAVGFIVSALVFKKIGVFRKLRSPLERSALRHSIEKLKARLTPGE